MSTGQILEPTKATIVDRLWDSFFRPTSRSERRSFYIGLAVLIGAGCAWLGASQRPIAFPMDDAYITLHNAQVLLSGTDRNYPGVPALMGSTSPVHLVLVAALMLAFDPLVASFIAGAVAILLYALGLARLAFQNGGSRVLAALVIVLGTLTGYALYHLLNGLETGLAMAATTWVLVFAGQPLRGIAVPLLCGLLPFIRPELAALSVPLLLLRCWRHWQEGKRYGTTARHILRDLALTVIVAGPWLTWEWFSLGTILPPTALAKQAFFAEQGLPALDKAVMVARGFLQSGLVPLIPAVIFVRRDHLAFCLWIFALAVVTAWYHSFPGGAAQNFSRYDFILLPPLMYGVASSLRNWPKLLGLAIVPAALALLPRCALDLYGGMRFTRTELSAVAQWSNDNLPSDARILVHDTGYFAFATPFRLIDAVGLKTPESVAYHRQWTAPTVGRDRDIAIDAIARRFAPDYAIIFHDRGQYWEAIGSYLARWNWTLIAVRTPPEPYGYFVFKLSPP